MYLQGFLLAVLALAGVEDWSRDQTLATLLGLAIVLGPYFQYRGKVPDLAARMVNILVLQVISYSIDNIMLYIGDCI